LTFDICSDYFDFEKKEYKERKDIKCITNIEKIKKLRNDYVNQEQKTEREKKNSYENHLNSSSYSKLSFSNSRN
jgi:hypothetical protein